MNFSLTDLLKRAKPFESKVRVPCKSDFFDVEEEY